MASVESQVQEKVDTAVLVKSAELFGRSMASFLETEMDYIGYLRERRSTLVAENSAIKKQIDSSGTTPQDVQGDKKRGGFNFWNLLRAKPKRPGGIRSSMRSERRYQRSVRNTNNALKNRGLSPSQTQAYRTARAGGATPQQALAQARKAAPKGTGAPVSTGPGALGVAGSFLGRALLLYGLYEQTKEVFNPNDNIITALGDLGTSTYNMFQSNPNKKKLFDVRGEGREAQINQWHNERILRERANYQPTTPGFSEGRAINTPTRAYIGEAGPEVIFPVGKIGEAINAVYREGGSAMVGATLAFLHASPRSATNSALLSEAGRLKQQFGVSGDFAQIQGIGHYEVKPVPSLEESINNQSSSGETTTGSQSIVQQFLNFGGGVVNSILGISPANAQQFNGVFLRGDLANTQVQNEITAKGLYLGAGKKKDGATGHQHIGISSRVFGTKDGVGSGASAAGHGGIDIGTSYQKGYYVSFGMSGKVVFAGPQGGYGNLVIIESGGHDYYFAHLANISSGLTVGQPYTGQTIGEIGNTGNSYGEHLHFEKRTAGGGTGTRMNPAAELGALSIGRRTKATAPANKPVKPADPSAANKTVTTAPVTQTAKNGEAAPTQVPVPIPVPQVVKQMVPVPIKEAVNLLWMFLAKVEVENNGRR
jgi:murein DD-endopeptidase MepM/ murein hydrolase activator NlpD